MYWVKENADTLKKMGYEELTDPQVKYFDDPKYRAQLREALGKFIDQH